MTGNTSIIMYFFQAGLVVKSVMLMLLIASIVSWTLIFQRAWYFKYKKKEAAHFLSLFKLSSDLSRLYVELDKQEGNKRGLAAIFQAGFKTFIRGRKTGNWQIETIERAMSIPFTEEADRLEQHLPFFASVGSIAPYVGLFGTVWGIMTSLQALGQAQQATISMVAPGISEALVATALGLFTAIPAVIAYNRYTTKLNQLLKEYELFQEEFILILEQQKSAQTAQG